MSDLLLEIGKVPQLRKAIGALGLPIPLPEPLRRSLGPAPQRPVEGRVYVHARAQGAQLTAQVEATLRAAGASLSLDGRSGRGALDGVVLDASGVTDVASLRSLYDEMGPLAGRIGRSGRVVVLGRPEQGGPPEAAMAQAALEGFARSLAKEIGRRGATCNLLRVEPGAEGRLAPVLSWVLSDRSAFVTAQPISIGTAARGEGPFAATLALSGKVALVTGAARGIGAATARALAAEGARVVCVDRPADEAETKRLAGEIGGKAVSVDVTAADAPADIAIALEGGVDVIVHNAGITRDKTLARMKPEHWDQVMAVNASALVRLQAALDPRLRDGGRVIALSSIAGIAGNMGQTNYAASKAGVAGWVRALSRTLAPRGITANAVAPGFIETRMTAVVPLAIREGARRLSALGQGGQPDDVAQAITFLASPGAVGVTGAVLRVCGGALVGA